MVKFAIHMPSEKGKFFPGTIRQLGGHPGEDHNCRCYAEPAFRALPQAPTKIRNEYLIAGPFGKWGPWVEIFDLFDSEVGREEGSLEITHIVNIEFNRRGDGLESTFEVEIEGLGQSEIVVGPGSTTITHTYTLSGETYVTNPIVHSFSEKLRARARAHNLTQNVDVRVTYQ